MSKKIFFICMCVLGVIFAAMAWWGFTHNAPILQPRGPIAAEQRELIFIALALSLFVVVPVFVMTIAIVWRYRVGNKKATYSPKLDRSVLAETVWWSVPAAIILVLSVITWISTHKLDPFRPLDSQAQPLKVQVVALNWKWLFIYPDQRVASVNEVALPINRPVNFEITSAGPMNSFWIPNLGGQIYAMSGMSTKLHLLGNTAGTYDGVSANLSGQGFSGMRFKARVMAENEFNTWVESASYGRLLDRDSYAELAKPSTSNPPTYYKLAKDNLYNDIVMKYMMPAKNEVHDHHSHMEMQ